MKKILLSVAIALLSATGFAQNDAPVTFFGETEPVVEIRGSSWVGEFSKLGWSVGTYSDTPGQLFNYLYLYNYSLNGTVLVQPGSKLILKVNGQPMVLTTEQGTFFDGGAKTSLTWSPRFNAYINAYESSVYYELTQEQVELINTYGISKYRFQVDNNVYERDNMNAEKIARKMKRSYDRLSGKQVDKSKKLNDLSDF